MLTGKSKRLFVISKSFYGSPENCFGGEIPSSIGTLSSLDTLQLLRSKGRLEHDALFAPYIDPHRLCDVVDIRICRFCDLRDEMNRITRKTKGKCDTQLCLNVLFLVILNAIFLLSLFFFCKRDSLLHCKNSSVLDVKASDYCHLSYPSYPKTNLWNKDVGCCSWDGVTCENVTGLKDLDLSFNMISGEIPERFWGISHDTLEKLIISHNLLNGTSNNDFTGEISSSICQLSSLKVLDLSKNNLFGYMPPCFGDITNLMNLDLSNNKIQGPLPRSLVKCTNLLVLLLSDNKFSDIFPHWLKVPQLYTLNLQSNNFHGRINLTALRLSFPALAYLFLSNNNFIGWSNNFAGNIPSLICNATKVEMIDLSNNSLTGSLPPCITNFSTHLSVLNLGMNHLEGTIPQSFSWRNSLATLDLSQNQFEGKLLESLTKCDYLEVLDLSDNRIKDTFPGWLGILPQLKVLVLRSNNFNGFLDIPRQADLFPKLRILDLSNNKFSSPLPANLIMNLKAMINGMDELETPLYMTQSFEKRNIPEVVGHLNFLLGLNLSHNHLTSSIPLTLWNLIKLEWLDLSSNKFCGGIPRALGDLSFLGCLNLSNSQLTGQIPRDKQLVTFESDSFIGNPGLCGAPFPKECSPGLSSSTFNCKEHEIWLKHRTVWIGYSSGIVIGIFIAYIAVEIGRPKWFAQGVRMLERGAAKWMEKPKWKAIKFHGK
ncbi:hypothetical protein BT93_A2362 [Corymbia citriodora subsp. variegata]|nr:hypothetical protein BT93_A2362 [Corymbia citriodora subsp. variegata]